MMERKLRRVGCSLVMTIPSQFATAWNWAEGDMLEIRVDNVGEFVVRKKR